MPDLLSHACLARSLCVTSTPRTTRVCAGSTVLELGDTSQAAMHDMQAAAVQPARSPPAARRARLPVARSPDAGARRGGFSSMTFDSHRYLPTGSKHGSSSAEQLSGSGGHGGARGDSAARPATAGAVRSGLILQAAVERAAGGREAAGAAHAGLCMLVCRDSCRPCMCVCSVLSRAMDVRLDRRRRGLKPPSRLQV